MTALFDELPAVTRPSRVVSLSGTVLPEVFEREVAKHYKAYRSEPPELVLDFSDCEYVEIPALACAVALVRSRGLRRKPTGIRVPKKKSVRDILKVWRFYEAAAFAVDAPVEKLIYLDLPLFQEPVTSFVGHPTGIAALRYNPSWRPGSPSQRSFFEFLSFPLAQTASGIPSQMAISIPRREAERWQGSLIKSVLGKYLPGANGDENDIGRVVIFESMANAIQHPQAHLLQVSSRFYQGNTGGTGGTLALTVWDDGESMIETLQSAVHAGAPLRTVDFPRAWYSRIALSCKDIAGKPVRLNRDSYDQADIPTKDSTPVELLLGCLSPGITRALAKPVSEVEAVQSTGGLGGQKGMGLFTLMRTVVDRFNGQLAIRTGQYFVSLSQAKRERGKGCHYRASITQYPAERDYPRFLGNLLTIRIPTREIRG